MRRAVGPGIRDSITKSDELKTGFVKIKSSVAIEYCEWVVFAIHSFFPSKSATMRLALASFTAA
jgi:hypothetical protein